MSNETILKFLFTNNQLKPYIYRKMLYSGTQGNFLQRGCSIAGIAGHFKQIGYGGVPERTVKFLLFECRGTCTTLNTNKRNSL